MIDLQATDQVFFPLNFSRNRLEVLIDPADPALTDRASLRYALTLLVPEYPQSQNLEELTTLQGRERPPQTTAGIVQYDGAPFRIDPVLDGFLEAQKPAFGQTDMSVIPTLTMPYARIEHVTGGTPAVDLHTDREPEWIFRGGLSNEDFAGWGSRFFDGYLAQTRQFLSWQPAVKTISIWQPEYLYFLLNFSPLPAQINRRVRVTYTDGNSQISTKGTLSGASLYQVVCVPAGPDALELGPDVVSYQVWLSDENNRRISQVRTYQIDYRLRTSERFLLLENSLSGFDTLRLLGRLEERETVSRQTVETDDFGATAVDFASLRVVKTETETTLTVSTGYFERHAEQWNRYLSELLLSRSMYLVTEKGHIPLTLVTSDRISHDDDADLLACTLVFQKSNPQQSFSELPATTPRAARATGWRGMGFRHVLDSMGKRTALGVPIRLRKYYLDDGQDVKPLAEKVNVPGDPDYLAPTPIPGVVVGSTPYPSAPISRPGSYRRTTCPSGQEGGPATIVIPAGKYGGEAAGEANRLAEAEYNALNTQAYANANGSCSLSENYSWDVPVNHFHVRFSDPTKLSIYHFNDQGAADMGNIPSLQGQSGTYVYPTFSNDLNFPWDGLAWRWRFYAFGTPGQNRTVIVYRNGEQLYSRQFNINTEGFEHFALLVDVIEHPLSSGDKLFIKLI